MESYLYWLALKQVSGVGPTLYKRLIETFTTPEAVFAADEEALWAVEGISERLARNICTFNAFDDAKKEMEKIEKAEVRLVTLNDTRYPALLKNIPDPPPVLYLRGTDIIEQTDPGGRVDGNESQEPEKERYCVAVVGARKMTPYGTSVAEQIAGGLARAGITVVSGFARGIDATAHRAALAAGGKTWAVLGCGIDCIYPPEHRKLYHEIMEQGVILSEFPMGTSPEPHNFPRRNRIISGLSLGCVVIEASQQSGSLITARAAVEQGREVFAVPGSILVESSKGTHALIRSGAKLVEDVADILEELLPQLLTRRSEQTMAKNEIASSSSTPTMVSEDGRSTVNPPHLVGEEETLYRVLSREPKHIDTIIEALSWDPSRVSYRLLELELKGVVRQAAGQFYVKV